MSNSGYDLPSNSHTSDSIRNIRSTMCCVKMIDLNHQAPQHNMQLNASYITSMLYWRIPVMAFLKEITPNCPFSKIVLLSKAFSQSS